MTAPPPDPSGLHGLLSVLCTPFDGSGAPDLASLRRLVEHNLAAGVHGVVCFGLAGEPYKLTDDERREILRTVVEVVGGRVPVLAGTEHSGVEAAVRRSVEAQELGADALMMYPPTFVKPGPDGVADYFASVGRAVDVPIVVQDAPAWTGVPLPVDLLAAIHREVPRVGHVKVEAPPTATKMVELRAAGLATVGGYGALHLAEELAAGIVAFMPGCALPAVYRELWDAHARGNTDEIWAQFTNVLPLLAFQMSSLDTFVAVQKLLLHRWGVLASPRMRRPGTPLSDEQVAWLDRLLDRCGLDRRPRSRPGAEEQT